MANTEGMPDEFVESLAMASSTTTTRTSSSSRRLSRLQERMEMPMGGEGSRPAAKVIRKSAPAVKSSSSSSSTIQIQERPPTSEQSAPAPPALALVGSVLERSAPTHAGASSSTAHKGKKPSRFAQQQAQLKASSNNQGFPSVNMPLGTFLKKKPSTATTKSESPSNPQQQYTLPIPASSSSTTQTASQDNSSSNNTKDDSSMLLQASRQEASSMLSDMSRDEILEAQQELTASLSPDMLAFLQARGKAKQKKNSNQQQTASSRITSSASKPTTPVPQPQQSRQPPRSSNLASSTQEKERLASLVSSVQTHDDLDKLYQQELQQEHPLDGDKQTPGGGDTFPLACDLLRSSVPRQALWAAKQVRDHLQERVDKLIKTKTGASDRDWPTLLPVSLRCLLDQPSGANGYILHSYVIQSLQYLIQLELPHFASDRDIWIHQLHFMEDAVPTTQSVFPSVQVKPLTVQETGTSKPVAYATSSSSTSAQEDAVAFEKDPLWTLLSKMRLLPRLAQLLNQNSVLPQEFVAASSKVLQLLCQRSPGAASAIAQHPTLVQALLQATILEDRHLVAIDLATITLGFFCVLARQSRVAAESLKVQEWLPQILGVPASNQKHFELQQRAIVLWRTCLRYGLALQCTSDILQLAAAKHLTLPFSERFSLSTLFLSAFAQVLECVHIAQSKPEEKAKAKITGEQWQVLSQAASWLSLTRRNVWSTISAESSENVEDGDSVDLKAVLGWHAARIRFLGAFFQISSVLQNSPNSQSEFKADEISMEEELGLLESIDRWLDTRGFVQKACSVIASSGISTNVITHDDTVDYELEATSSSFLASLVLLVLAFEKDPSKTGNAMVRSLSRSITQRLVAALLSCLQKASSRSNVSTNQTSHAPFRQGWINQSHFSMAKILAHAASLEILSSADSSLVRLLVFALLGRLTRGQEAIGAVLFSMDTLFQPNTNPLEEDFTSSSPISSLFLGEICGSQSARKQLDHSFKLQHGFGLTSDEFGPFELDSLISNADNMVPNHGNSELILPIGRYWLWKTLSGSVQTNTKPFSHGTTEGTSVVAATLNILLEIEQQEEISNLRGHGYSSKIPLGAKLYYLMNVCLHHEDILQDSKVLESAEALFDMLFRRISKSSIQAFGNACFHHISTTRSHQNETEEEKLDEKDEKLLKMFNPEPIDKVSLSTEELKALDAFIEDLLAAFNDYGAQYDFFIKCMRLFLMSMFPTSIRCKALKELSGVLHLLTLPGELEDTSSTGICLVLSKGINGGLPAKDQSLRDSSDLLNLVASFTRPGGTARAPEGFFLLLSIALLARNLAICLSEDDSTGLEAFKKRIAVVDAGIADRIFQVTRDFLGSDGCVDDLINAIVNHRVVVEQQGRVKTEVQIYEGIQQLL